MNNSWTLYLGVGLAAFLGYHYLSNGRANAPVSASPDPSQSLYDMYGIAPLSGGMSGAITPDAVSTGGNPTGADFSISDLMAAEKDAANKSLITSGAFGLLSQFLNAGGVEHFSGFFGIPGSDPLTFSLSKDFAPPVQQIVSSGPAVVYQQPDNAPDNFATAAIKTLSDIVTNLFTPTTVIAPAPAPTSFAALPSLQSLIPAAPAPDVTQAPAVAATVPGSISFPALPAPPVDNAQTYDMSSPADVQAAAQGAPYDMTLRYRAAAGYQPAIDQLAAMGETPATLAPVDTSTPIVTLPDAPAPTPTTTASNFTYGIDTSQYGSDPESQRQLIQDLNAAKSDYGKATVAEASY
jgi:hypothetical protein